MLSPRVQAYILAVHHSELRVQHKEGRNKAWHTIIPRGEVRRHTAALLVRLARPLAIPCIFSFPLPSLRHSSRQCECDLGISDVACTSNHNLPHGR